ncbi:MAG: hypothetical protein K2X74_00540 [Acetobacteraceae bacterium]|nr:hypothetical protein [Acetobacteraceae bacterium]
MSDAGKLRIEEMLQSLAKVWQAAVALVGLGMIYAQMQAADRQLASDIRQSVTLGDERRVALERRVEERDQRHEAALVALTARATASEIAMARFAADLASVKTGVDELVRDNRAQRGR